MLEIDFTKLVGFAAVSETLKETVDFQARLGAKVGLELMALLISPED